MSIHGYFGGLKFEGLLKNSIIPQRKVFSTLQKEVESKKFIINKRKSNTPVYADVKSLKMHTLKAEKRLAYLA